MLVNRLVLSALTLGALSVTADVQASAAGASESCVFDKHAPTTVASFPATDVGADWGSYHPLGGAQLFIPARQGLTKEQLHASVQQALRVARAADSDTKSACDLPRVKNVHVNVVSAGHGYWVQLLGADNRTSEALLAWARKIAEAPAAQSGGTTTPLLSPHAEMYSSSPF